MARKSEVQAEIDRLNKELETADDDTDEEVWVRKDGHETKLTGARAQAWLRKHGYADDQDDAGKTGEEKDAPTTPDDKPPAGPRYFRGKG